MGFSIPDRVDNSMTGSQFVSTIFQNAGQVREDAVLQQLALGNVPSFMRTPVQVSIVAGNHSIVLDVLPDYFCIGVDEDFVRFPLLPRTAQVIADQFNALLPTRKVVNEIWTAAAVQLTPQPMPPSAQMNSTDAYQRHNHMIEGQRAGRVGLVAGHKKDIIITPQLLTHHRCVAIYGWHRLNGQPIQQLNAVSHSDVYVDYSHGVRFVCRDVLVDEEPALLDDVLASKELSVLVSDEGPSTFLRYPV